MAARLTWHDEKFNEQVLSADWMVALMLERAEAGAAYAESIAPSHLGTFRKSIRAEADVRPAEGKRTQRASGRVVSDDPAAIYIEYGTRDSEHHKATPAHRTLGKSLDAMGR